MTYIINKNRIITSLPIATASAIILLTYFGVNKYNIFWWSMYLVAPQLAIFAFIIRGNVYKISAWYRRELFLIIMFVFHSIMSIFINQCNFWDGLFVILYRLAPLVFIMAAFDLATQTKKGGSSVGEIIKFIFTFVNVTLQLVGFYQYYVLGLEEDQLTSLCGNAHRFSFLVVYTSLYLYMVEGRKKRYLCLFISSTLLALIADYKLGLVVLVTSFPIYVVSKVLYIRKKNILVGMSAVMAVVLVYNYTMKESITILPKKYERNYMLFTSVFSYDYLKENINEVYPDNFEIFKGYIQIFTRIINSFNGYVFGVGPGNYATNIAQNKEKENYTIHVKKYRDELTKLGYGSGTLSNRRGMLINIIAEFGVVGGVLYLYITISLIHFPLKLFLRKRKYARASVGAKKRVDFYLFFIVVTIIEAPFSKVYEASYIVAFIVLLGLGLLEVYKREFAWKV